MTRQWTGDKPSTGLAEAAREARYRLLAEAAREADADMVVTGHTRDDQAETFAMRQARGEGRGLAGMDRLTLYDRWLWIARPLLGLGRQELRHWLAAREVGWIDDPSNERLESERVRVRRQLASDPQRVKDAADRADVARVERAAVGLKAAAVLDQGAMVSPGLVRIGPAVVESHEPAVLRYALGILTAVMGGRTQLAEIGFDVDSLRGAVPRRNTISRCVVDCRGSGIFVHRERRGLPPPQIVPRETVWDGRIIVRSLDRPVHVRPTGPQAARSLAQPDKGVPLSLAVAALAAEPWLSFDATADTGSLAGNEVALERIVAPWRRFLPRCDIAAHNAVASLVGARTVADAPWASHIGGGA